MRQWTMGPWNMGPKDQETKGPWGRETKIESRKLTRERQEVRGGTRREDRGDGRWEKSKVV